MNRLVSLARRVLPNRRAPGTMRVGPGAGLRFDAGPSNPEYDSGDNELPVQEALARHLRHGSVFYDVGANVGFLTVIAARLTGPQGRVYAFEPVPRNAAFVRRNVAANGFAHVQVFEKAVAGHSGSGELALARCSGGAVLASAGMPPDSAGTLQVALVTIDEMIERHGLPPPNLVKIDVEGAELDVLKGMARTVERSHPAILYEVDDGDPAALLRKQSLCEDWLRARGYRVEELPASYTGIRWLVRHFMATPGVDPQPETPSAAAEDAAASTDDHRTGAAPPLVSLGLPVFNGEEFLEACLQSIAAQTWRDFELVICDNASTDATAAIAQAWCDRDPRFSYHRAPSNRGAARNFNWAFELARGELFKWCAADDLLTPTFLASCVQALRARPDAVLAYSGTLQIDAEGTVTGEIYDNRLDLGFGAVEAPRRLQGLILNEHSCISVFGVIRRVALKGSSLIGPYPGSDRALLVELGLQAPFVRVDANLLLHREHLRRSVTQYPRLRDRAQWFSGRGQWLAFPHCRLFGEYVLAVAKRRMPLKDRLHCGGSLLRWIYWGGWRGMLADVTNHFR